MGIGYWGLGGDLDDAGVVPGVVDGELIVGGAGGVGGGVVAPGAEFGGDVFGCGFFGSDFALDEDGGEGGLDVALVEGGEGDGGGEESAGGFGGGAEHVAAVLGEVSEVEVSVEPWKLFHESL